jgi:serine/threonine protein kinase
MDTDTSHVTSRAPCSLPAAPMSKQMSSKAGSQSKVSPGRRAEPDAMAATTASQARSIVGRKWAILERIGQGTFSEVYAASHKTDGRIVAVKVEKSGSTPQLDDEALTLRALQPYPFFPRLISVV